MNLWKRNNKKNSVFKKLDIESYKGDEIFEYLENQKF